jgi:hypothetical protein
MLGMKSLQFLPHDVFQTEDQVDQRPSAAPKRRRQRPDQSCVAAGYMYNVVAAAERITRNERGEACIENPGIPKSCRNIVRKQIVDLMTELRQGRPDP